MQVHHAIETKVREAFNPTYLEVKNESATHNVPKGSETHFRVTVVSPKFEGVSGVKRHQLVYATLREELAGGVHALAIAARTPAEWRESQDAGVSPRCLGGRVQDSAIPALAAPLRGSKPT